MGSDSIVFQLNRLQRLDLRGVSSTFEDVTWLRQFQGRQIALDRGLYATDVQPVGKPNKPLGFVL